MKIYNSLSNKVEDFKSIEENKLSMYVCGPTVYNDPHIGNARPLIVFDLVNRFFRALGYEVNYVSNYTDIDDKIINRALELNISANELSERYIKAYEKLSDDLNILRPKTIKVTETMDKIKAYIQMLIDEGYAYEVSGDVYFRVSKVEDYGKLSKQNVDDLVVGARIEENSLKENPLDFTLWKKTEIGENYSSNWSEGRPGWHTECVVMIEESFNSIIDIHGGGLDLKFPHHENELAQAIKHEDHGLANYWMHNGLVNINDKKMSKSEGELILAKDMVSDLGYDLVRWIILSTHYRAPLNLNEEIIESSKIELERIYGTLNKAYSTIILNEKYFNDEYDLDSYDKFIEALANDFNTQNAYKVIFDTIKVLNASLRVRELDYNLLINLINSVKKMLEILGISYTYPNIEDEDINNYKKWNEYKMAKNFDEADKYRNLLLEKGLI